MGGDGYSARTVTTSICFNPRPRMGGDRVQRLEDIRACVSIHAPAWGATASVVGIDTTAIVSIHAPAWGATPLLCHNRRTAAFQSTPPHGGRLVAAGAGLAIDYVSIHAPAWGATANGYSRHNRPVGVSIHAPAWGATITGVIWLKPNWFQSTPPHGGRHSAGIISVTDFGFNPRPRMGGDEAQITKAYTMACFNPRPRMGGDQGTANQDCRTKVSIHAPAWGATSNRKRQ